MFVSAVTGIFTFHTPLYDVLLSQTVISIRQSVSIKYLVSQSSNHFLGQCSARTTELLQQAIHVQLQAHLGMPSKGAIAAQKNLRSEKVESLFQYGFWESMLISLHILCSDINCYIQLFTIR